MAKPGPAPKPTALRVAEGNPGKRALPVNEPQPEPLVEIPKPPSFLMDLAKKHWKEQAEILQRAGLLTEVDLDAFAAMCNSYATWVDAQRQLKKTGMLVRGPSGHPVMSPYISISEKALNRLLQYQKEFGLTPSSRTRVQLDSGDGEEDEFSEFLKKGEQGAAG